MKERKYIANEARLVGTVVDKETTSKATVFAVEAMGETVPCIAFAAAKKFADTVNIGDRIKVSATLQSNKREPGKSPKTIAINHIAVAGENTEEVNAFSLYGRMVHLRPRGETLLGILKTDTPKPNYIKVWFYGVDAEKAATLTRNNFVNVRGYFETTPLGKTECVVKKWRHTRPR